jgi:hypothetical protein
MIAGAVTRADSSVETKVAYVYTGRFGAPTPY